jgi:hypothetical protein
MRMRRITSQLQINVHLQILMDFRAVLSLKKKTVETLAFVGGSADFLTLAILS